MLGMVKEDLTNTALCLFFKNTRACFEQGVIAYGSYGILFISNEKIDSSC